MMIAGITVQVATGVLKCLLHEAFANARPKLFEIWDAVSTILPSYLAQSLW